MLNLNMSINTVLFLTYSHFQGRLFHGTTKVKSIKPHRLIPMAPMFAVSGKQDRASREVKVLYCSPLRKIRKYKNVDEMGKCLLLLGL
jgi:hypothetical protein